MGLVCFGLVRRRNNNRYKSSWSRPKISPNAVREYRMDSRSRESTIRMSAYTGCKFTRGGLCSSVSLRRSKMSMISCFNRAAKNSSENTRFLRHEKITGKRPQERKLQRAHLFRPRWRAFAQDVIISLNTVTNCTGWSLDAIYNVQMNQTNT